MIRFVKSLFQRFRAEAPASSPDTNPLHGAPSHARVKTYSAVTGYVYQYVFRGYQSSPQASGTEYVFSVSGQGGTWPVTILLLNDVLDECARDIGRDLMNQERYAVAKLTLFSAFDEADGPAHFTAPIAPNSTQMREHLETLGRA